MANFTDIKPSKDVKIEFTGKTQVTVFTNE